MKARILMVDDDRHVTDVLTRYARDEGYETATAANAAAAIELAERWQPELIVLDLRLPDASGMDAFHRLRKVSNAPVIMLTAYDEEVQRILGLELGADDYVTKPFSPREVIARIRNVLRRAAAAPESADESSLRIGDLEIDREAREVRVGGRETALTRTEYRILELLAQRPGRTFARAELLEALHADTDVYDRTLDKHMTNLRRKIEPDPAAPRYIQTVYGVGYKLRKDVAALMQPRR
ncbi:MAG TPA: response regulator transcription factor [Candidatus Baltobacteraceae bacterium]|nr:response regulator transcription factor [Candidatus Baltobacteraceae bacterium]